MGDGLPEEPADLRRQDLKGRSGRPGRLVPVDLTVLSGHGAAVESGPVMPDVVAREQREPPPAFGRQRRVAPEPGGGEPLCGMALSRGRDGRAPGAGVAARGEFLGRPPLAAFELERQRRRVEPRPVTTAGHSTPGIDQRGVQLIAAPFFEVLPRGTRQRTR